MPIVTSQIVENYTYEVSCPTHHTTEDRRSVREEHTDHLGEIYTVSYRTNDLASNVTAVMATHADEIEARLEAEEIQKNLNEVLE